MNHVVCFKLFGTDAFLNNCDGVSRSDRAARRFPSKLAHEIAYALSQAGVFRGIPISCPTVCHVTAGVRRKE